MSDETPKPAATPVKLKIGGLGPKAQKLQAARDKAAHVKAGGKAHSGADKAAFKSKDNFAGTKKTNFQRKAV
jgi:hypothetical protein